MDPSEIPLLRIKLLNVFKSDFVLCDAECNRFSLNMRLERDEETNPDGVFEHCSDRIERLFPTYLLDDKFHFIPGPQTPTINFDYLKALLLSTDQDRYTELQQLTEGGKCQFLDGKVDLFGQRVAFQSFPRSGNTFLRSYLEKVTGVFTGADMDIDWTFMEACMGFLGQNITGDSNRIFITKTHEPGMTPANPKPFTAQKMIVIARNPIDVIPSFALLKHTGSHSLTINEEWHEAFPEFWDSFVTVIVEGLKKNHEAVRDIAV